MALPCPRKVRNSGDAILINHVDSPLDCSALWLKHLINTQNCDVEMLRVYSPLANYAKSNPTVRY